MAGQFEVATYFVPPNRLIRVSRVMPEMADTAAAQIHALGRAAFTANFEPRDVIPTGSIGASVFNEARIDMLDQEAAEIRRGHKRQDTHYWMISESAPPAIELRGFVKTRKVAPNTCFIDNICVEPPYQKQGLGSAGLYTALWGHKRNHQLMADLFEANDQLQPGDNHSTNDWFRGLGFEPYGDSVPHETLPMLRKRRHLGHASVGNVLKLLAARSPWLTSVEWDHSG